MANTVLFKAYQKRWRERNKKRLKLYWKAYYEVHRDSESLRGKCYYIKHRKSALARARKSYSHNKATVKERTLRWRLEHPDQTRFSNRLWAIRRRCGDPAFISYKHYGGRGIKCFLSLDDLKRLWVRDKADQMAHPTVDRIDNDGNYIYSNCRFIERCENSSKMNRDRKKKYCCLHGSGCGG